MDPVESVLAHYGVRGMKWGVRRRSSSSSSSAEASDDYKMAKAALSKPSHALSNNEMDALIRRMDLESRYTSALAKANAKPTTRGGVIKKFVSNLLIDIGRTEVTRIAKGSSQLLVERKLSKTPIDKTFGADLAERIKPKKK